MLVEGYRYTASWTVVAMLVMVSVPAGCTSNLDYQAPPPTVIFGAPTPIGPEVEATQQRIAPPTAVAGAPTPIGPEAKVAQQTIAPIGTELATILVNPVENVRTISPYIYGISRSEGAKPYFAEMGVSVVRWGGNSRSRFNWEINASNAGSDWKFRNLAKGDKVPGSAAVQFHHRQQEAGAQSLLTIPMIGWVAADKRKNADSLKAASFLAVARKSTPFQYPPDMEDKVVYQDEWVAYLTRALGPSRSGGIRFYEMDNEPMLWSDTHADIRPEPMGYDEYLTRFLEYSNAVKDVDPTAQVLGPSVWGWTAYFYSALDRGNNNYRTAADRTQHGGVAFLPWFLAKVREHDLSRGRRSLDMLSVHYYPEARVFSDDTDGRTNSKRLRSTRSLWDTTYAEESWIGRTEEGPYVYLIPRLKAWIAQFYPGTGLAITEWNWGAEDHISGGVAVAEVLGILGKEGVDLATYWGTPKQGSPVYWAFRMYRNYDGSGQSFGDLSVKAESSRPELVSSYASKDSNTGQIKLILLNKSPEKRVHILVKLAGVSSAFPISAYQYSIETLDNSRQLPSAHLATKGISYELPPYSITLLVVNPGDGRLDRGR